MRLSDVYADSKKTQSQIEMERKLSKMEREIHRDETESHIDIPFLLRNEYYDDSYDSILDDGTESKLLDREINRLRTNAKNKS